MLEETDTQLAAEFFLAIGLAVSGFQAEQMADILYAPELSPESVLCLLWLGIKKGAEFDVLELTEREINEACDEIDSIRLALTPCMGEA